MSRKIYVGNLSYSTDKQTLHDVFSECGTVDLINLVTDKITGHSKGFAIIEMSRRSEASRAIQKLNGSNVSDRAIKVSEFKPKSNQKSRGSYGQNKRWQ
jgi:RNA recognition motif-containing protein